MRPRPQAKPRSCAGLVALIVGFLATLALPASAATVATDKADYAPGENVVITGSGWEPSETVVLILHEDPELDPDLQLTAFADENGDFTNTDFSVDVFDIGVTFTLTATGGSSGLTAETTFADANPCGNGVLDSGEDCDLGSAINGSGSSCCKNNCTFQPVTNVCRNAVNECDLAETCTGFSATCPADAVKSAGTVCTDDGNPCTTDVCNGTVGSPACQHPAGNAGATCTDDGNPCTLDQCDGTSTTCQHPAGNAGAVCRAAAGVCDVAETCDGSSITCPADAKVLAGTACTPDTNPCTLDQCDGTSNACQHPAGNAGAACPDDGNPCTLDKCDGTSTTCQHPAGNAGAVCRAAADECDAVETCTGTSTTCPTNVKLPAGTACTDDGNPCTLDQCNGTSNACQHPAGNAGATCADDGNPCTTDTCDG